MCSREGVLGSNPTTPKILPKVFVARRRLLRNAPSKGHHSPYITLFFEGTYSVIGFYELMRMCNGSSDSTQIIHQCHQNFNDSQMYISAVNFPLVFIFSVRRQMSPVSARRVAFVFRDFPIGFI